MTINEIIEDTLTEKYIIKKTKEEFIKIPSYKIYDGIIQIFTPVRPYRLVILRRLLNSANIEYKNIIVGHPDV